MATKRVLRRRDFVIPADREDEQRTEERQERDDGKDWPAGHQCGTSETAEHVIGDERRTPISMAKA